MREDSSSDGRRVLAGDGTIIVGGRTTSIREQPGTTAGDISWEQSCRLCSSAVQNVARQLGTCARGTELVVRAATGPPTSNKKAEPSKRRKRGAH